ncbi:MAG: sigma-54-dependent transcriptional regulator [Planctomycetota bacterium]
MTDAPLATPPCSRTATILVVDDESDLVESTAFFLRRAGYTVNTALSGSGALQALAKTQFDVVLSDVRMPEMSGVELLRAIKARDPDIEVILVTAFPDLEVAVASIKSGAFDYLKKPFDEAQLLSRVEKAIAHRGLKERNTAFRDRLRDRHSQRLVWRSPRFAKVVETIERAARTDASVLILGESGTGKELLAHHLHENSTRRDKPFVPVDCSTLQESLIESELFGHVKGAFSGATGSKMGLFQVADGGTLFLDEIGELPMNFQVKLLRAIQERQIRRVGGTETIDVDVRIVAATNRVLTDEVDAGRFRQDLYFRLDVVRIDVPPLRDRREDIEPLARHFLDEIREREPHCTVTGFSEAAIAAMLARDWPGNLRQLRNAVIRAAALGSGPRIELDDLPADDGRGGRPQPGEERLELSGETLAEIKSRTVAALEIGYVQELLRKYEGNVTRSAEEAGMARSAFQKLMQRYGIRSAEYR